MSAILDRFQTLCVHAKDAAASNEDLVSVYDAVAEVAGFLAERVSDLGEQRLLAELAASAALSSGRVRDVMQAEFEFSSLLEGQSRPGQSKQGDGEHHDS